MFTVLYNGRLFEFSTLQAAVDSVLYWRTRRGHPASAIMDPDGYVVPRSEWDRETLKKYGLRG